MANQVYYYSKLTNDFFDSTAWKIIFGAPMPIPAYATLIYFTILTESTPAQGTLLRSSDRAYTKEQLMALCHVGAYCADKDKADWEAAFDLLATERVIEVAEDGTIIVCLAEELFGSETYEAMRSRKRRIRAHSTTEEPSSDQTDCGNAPVERSDLGQDSVVLRSNDQETTANRPTPDLPHSSLPFPLKNETIKTPCHVPLPPAEEQSSRASKDAPAMGAAADQFLRIYPKKCDPSKILHLLQALTEEEREALLIAARRYAADPAKREEGGRFAADPAKFIKSRPWTDRDLKDARMKIMNRALPEEPDEGEGGNES